MPTTDDFLVDPGGWHAGATAPTPGLIYAIQNKGNTPVFVATGATPPTVADGSHGIMLSPGEARAFSPEGDFWFYNPARYPVPVNVSEAS